MKTIFQILLVALCFNISSSFASQTQSVDVTPPTAPTHLRGWTYDPDFIYMSWTPSTDDQGLYAYRIYRNGELIATTTDKYFLDMEYDRDLFNAFWLTAVDTAGNESKPSNLLKDPRFEN